MIPLCLLNQETTVLASRSGTLPAADDLVRFLSSSLRSSQSELNGKGILIGSCVPSASPKFVVVVDN